MANRQVAYRPLLLAIALLFPAMPSPIGRLEESVKARRKINDH